MNDCEHKPLCMTREETDAMRLDLSNVQCENFHLRAQVARLREALVFYSNGEHWDWHAEGSNQRILLDVGTKAANALSSLPDRAKRDAAVLRAAEKLVALEMRDDPHLSNLEWTDALQELCQAVRGAPSK